MPAGNPPRARFAALIQANSTNWAAWVQVADEIAGDIDPVYFLAVAIESARSLDVAGLILALLARARASDAHLDRVRTVLSAYLAGQVLADEVAGALLPLLGAA